MLVLRIRNSVKKIVYKYYVKNYYGFYEVQR